MYSLIIDNVMVSYFPSTKILKLSSLSSLDKKGINYSNVNRKTFGSRIKDNEILNKLTTGKLDFIDLFYINLEESKMKEEAIFKPYKYWIL